jgi:UDP-2,3-diacylglucosamine pyrophosphatase LpxH
MSSKRKIQVAVISDVHMGTYGCHSKELLQYLKSIEPEILILNGDIIDIWQFSKNYWPKSHTHVLNQILKMIGQGVKVYYITGNHDELLRRFTDFKLGDFVLTNKVILELDGKKTWFFHGDVFDVTMKNSKWLARLGGKGYDLLIMINQALNFVLEYFGKERISFSKKVKDSVKKAVKYISDFEATAAEMAIYHGYDYVICGHIHQPNHKIYETEHGKVTYLNSGDWVENLTALEYHEKEWTIYKYHKSHYEELSLEEEIIQLDLQFEEDLANEFMPVLQLVKAIV